MLRMHAGLYGRQAISQQKVGVCFGIFFIDPETYRKYKDQVLALSNSIQVNIHEHLPVEKRQGCLSDKEIAERLGLEERVVREIRVVAERDYYPMDEWEEAIRFKDEACRGFIQSGVSYATKKYAQKRKENA
ncbi:MAG: hypothetical protein HY647_12280 [Acidobacteria bacterium]|nr:hypothetical protein [Acidobacteriota bacterium]